MRQDIMGSKYLLLIVAGFILSVTGGSVNADSPIDARLDSLAKYVAMQKNPAGTATGQWSATRLYRAVNNAVAAVCRDFPAIEAVIAVTMDSAKEGFALPADFLRLKEVMRLDDSVRYPVKIIPNDSARFISEVGDPPRVEKCTAITMGLTTEGAALPVDFYAFKEVMRRSGQDRYPLTIVPSDSMIQVSMASGFEPTEKVLKVEMDSASEGYALPTDFLRLKSVLRCYGIMRYPLRVIPVDSIEHILLSVAEHNQDPDDTTSPGYAWSFADSIYTHPKYVADNLDKDTLIVFYYSETEDHAYDKNDPQSPRYVWSFADSLYVHPHFDTGVVTGDSTLTVFYYSKTRDNTQNKADPQSPMYAWSFVDSLYVHPHYIADDNSNATLLVFYYKEDARMEAVTDSTFIPTEYRPALVDHATSLMYEYTGQLNEAAYFMAKYQAAVERQKSGKRAVSYQEVTE